MLSVNILDAIKGYSKHKIQQCIQRAVEIFDSNWV